MTPLADRLCLPHCSPPDLIRACVRAVDVKRPEVRAFIEQTRRATTASSAPAARSAAEAGRDQAADPRCDQPPGRARRALARVSRPLPHREAHPAGRGLLDRRTARRCGSIPDPNVAASVVGILGVETSFGRITGRYRVLDALATLAFDYPPRSEFFRSELQQFLLLSREESSRSGDRARLVRRRDGRAAVHLLQLSQIRGRRRRQRQARPVEQLGRRDRLGRELSAGVRLARRRAGRRHRDAARATT